MSNNNVPQVFDSKTVLQNHVRAKLMQFIPVSLIVDDLAIELCEHRNNQDIIKLLVDNSSLKKAVLEIEGHGRTKQKLGEQLFYSVSNLESSICAQITGMLLELDVFTICDMLCDFDILEEAVIKAKKEFLKFKQKSSKDLIGEELYEKVLQQYPNDDLAARLTGMLLELDLSVLQTLLDDPVEFNARLAVAYETANTTQKQ